MIGFIRVWITSITAAAIVVSICMALTPKGTMRKYVQFTGGLVLLLVIANPIFKLDASEFFNFSQIYDLEFSDYEKNLDEENARMLKFIIEDKLETYILVKASEFGIDCDVKVETKMRDGYPYPHTVAVSINGDSGKASRDKLVYYIESELAIPAERQAWMENK